MPVNVTTFWHTICYSLLGELGDKTFVLTLALTAWCPWSGVRERDGRLEVVMGALLALWCRGLVLAFLPDPGYLNGSVDMTAFALLCFFTLRAYLHLRRVQPKRTDADVGSREDVEHRTEREEAPEYWNSSAFGGQSVLSGGYGPSYGSSESMPASGGTAEAQASTAAEKVQADDDSFALKWFAFTAALVMCFLVEAEDKSQATLLRAEHGSISAVVGGMVGFVPAVCMASFMGYLLERQCTDQGILTLVMLMMFMLAIVSLSQALLHIPTLEPHEVLALLGFVAGPQVHARHAH